ncbi:ribose ABC transporter permease [Planotetraspora thailandica]|uniref:Ribose ABC transporter permease n=1 Tax=Planotetraspora thailandica TaxID=487172 RepID=A0A8J3XZ30_9ACTN|nr:ABC transporter permease [Planotetraspora thailandica]GII56013.1 ribose ABC transporter permease [Planotetraspora thailandica]
MTTETIIERTGDKPAKISFGRLWDTWGVTAILILLLLCTPAIAPGFLEVENLQSVLRESAYVGIVAVGMTFAIASGAFDLSVGGQLALTSVVSLMAFSGGGTAAAIAAAIVTGLLCGLVNAGLITRLRVPPFVATLGSLFVFRGIAYLLTQDGPKTLPYSQIHSPFVKLGSLNIAGLPLPFIIMVAVFAGGWILLRRTAIGRRTLAYGSSPSAARFCGISDTRIRLFVFGLVGLTVGIAALTYITRVWTADGSAQDGFELKVIAAVVLGGTALKGGKGTLVGTFSAVFLVSVLNEVLVSRGVESAYQRIVLGCVLIVALTIDGLRTRFAGPGSFRRAITGLIPRKTTQATS